MVLVYLLGGINMFDSFYELKGYFIPCRFELSDKVNYWLEVSVKLWNDVISESLIFANNKGFKLNIDISKEEAFVYRNYYINKLLIGYVLYCKVEDFYYE